MALSIAADLVVALLIAWAAWYIGRRKGRMAMLAFWPLAAALVTGVMGLRVQLAQGGLPEPDVPLWLRSPFWTLLPVWFIGIGAMMLPLNQAIRDPEGTFSASLAVRCTVAFVFGEMVFLLVSFGFLLSHLPG